MTFKTEEMEMIPVPFSGDAASDPHSERFISDVEEGVILLPQKDRIRHSQGKLSLTELAQIHAEQAASTSTHTCAHSHDRNKESLPNFYNLPTGKFTDNTFTSSDALYWADYATQTNGYIKSIESYITWG